MGSDKSGKDTTKKGKKKTRVDDLEPHQDSDAKGGATLSLASTDTRVTADLYDTAKKITPTDLNYKITPETKPWAGCARSPDSGTASSMNGSGASAKRAARHSCHLGIHARIANTTEATAVPRNTAVKKPATGPFRERAMRRVDTMSPRAHRNRYAGQVLSV